MSLEFPPFPPCPACRAALSRSRVVDETWVAKTTLAFGIKKHWRYSIACGSCLAVVALAWAPREDEAMPGTAAVIAPGSMISRLRERLAAANQAGTIRPEVGRLLSDESYRVLLGVPELFPEIAQAIGRRLRLRTNACVAAGPDEPRPDVLADQPVALERYAFAMGLTREDLATAIVGEEGQRAGTARAVGEAAGREPGGVIRAPRSSMGRSVVLTGTRLTLTGVRNGGLLVEPPAWAAAVLGSSPLAIVPWGMATREAD